MKLNGTIVADSPSTTQSFYNHMKYCQLLRQQRLSSTTASRGMLATESLETGQSKQNHDVKLLKFKVSLNEISGLIFLYYFIIVHHIIIFYITYVCVCVCVCFSMLVLE
jgi:hypothetical protein